MAEQRLLLMEQELQRERDEALERAQAAAAKHKKCESELLQARRKAVAELKDKDQQITALRRSDKTAERKLRCALHDAEEGFEQVSREAGHMRSRYKYTQRQFRELEKQLAASKDAQARLQADLAATKRQLHDAESMLNRRDTAIAKLG